MTSKTWGKSSKKPSKFNKNLINQYFDVGVCYTKENSEAELDFFSSNTKYLTIPIHKLIESVFDDLTITKQSFKGDCNIFELSNCLWAEENQLGRNGALWCRHILNGERCENWDDKIYIIHILSEYLTFDLEYEEHFEFNQYSKWEFSDAIKSIILLIPEQFILAKIFKIRYDDEEQIAKSSGSDKESLYDNEFPAIYASIQSIIAFKNGHYVNFSLRCNTESKEKQLKWYYFEEDKVKEVGSYNNVQDVMLKLQIIPKILLYKSSMKTSDFEQLKSSRPQNSTFMKTISELTTTFGQKSAFQSSLSNIEEEKNNISWSELLRKDKKVESVEMGIYSDSKMKRLMQDIPIHNSSSKTDRSKSSSLGGITSWCCMRKNT